MQRNLMATIFLGGAIVLFGAYALVNQNEVGKQGSANGSNTPLLDGSSATMPSEGEGANSTWSNLLGTSDDKNNITKNMASVVFEQMKTLDQKGKNPFGDEAGSDLAAQKAIQDTIKNKTLLPDMVISMKDIKQTVNNSKTAKLAYVKQMEDIAVKYPAKKEYRAVLSGIQDDVNRACTSGDTGINKEMSDRYRMLAEAYAAVTVPTEWAEMHRTVVQHFKGGQVIFGAIANCLDDPMKAYAVVQLFPQFATDAGAMKETFEKMYSAVK